MTDTQPLGQNQFQDAEHLWFWFISSRRLQNGMNRGGGGTRPCELIDIETLVTRIYLSGRLSARQLEVLKKYGEMRRAPCQYVWAENKDTQLWAGAMNAISAAARKKGWVE
ncbi:MAG: hypothetical protein LBT45_03255 [Rickettsiales bacterium]|jgi:hypothetical protein|nr:hypothetical protein [Rickettsiales bacterium]